MLYYERERFGFDRELEVALESGGILDCACGQDLEGF